MFDFRYFILDKIRRVRSQNTVIKISSLLLRFLKEKYIFPKYRIPRLKKKKKIRTKQPTKLFPTNHVRDQININVLLRHFSFIVSFNFFFGLFLFFSFFFLTKSNQPSSPSRTNTHGIKARLASPPVISLFAVEPLCERATDERKNIFPWRFTLHKHPCWLVKRRCNC